MYTGSVQNPGMKTSTSGEDYLLQEENDRDERMSPGESELVRKAVEGVMQVFAQHQGGVFNAAALRQVDLHASTVRIYTTDTVCRQWFTYIQDRAPIYFSSNLHEDYRIGQMSGVAVVGAEIRRALSALRAQLQRLENDAQR